MSGVGNPTVAGLLFESVKTAASARLIGCDPATLDFEAQWAVWEMLRDLPIYRKVAIIPAVAEQTEYSLSLPPPEQAVVVLAAWYGTVPMSGGRAAPIARPSGTPDTVNLSPTNTVQIWPPPEAANLQTLRVEYTATILPLASVTSGYAFLTPTSPVVVIPPAEPPIIPDPYAAAPYVMPQCATAYLDVLLELLLARVLAIPDKPWTNTVAAARHRQAYSSYKQDALWSEHRSGVVGASRVRAPRFA